MLLPRSPCGDPLHGRRMPRAEVSTSSLDYAALDMPQGIAFEDIDSLSGSFQGAP